MPLARIITRAVEESQDLAADLRGRGFEVEIVSPSNVPKTRADLELRLEECTPEEALIRAGVLPETNDMAVFIAPGAIANRRQRERASVIPQFPPRGKWYDSEAMAVPPEILPFASKLLEEDFPQGQVDVAAIASEALSAASSVNAIHAEETRQITVAGDVADHAIANFEIQDRDDEPMFATTAREVPIVLTSPARVEQTGTLPVNAAVVKRAAEERVIAEAPVARRIEPKRATLPAPGRTAPGGTIAVSPVRRVRIPALAGKPWAISKTSAGFAAVAVLILVMGAWLFRKAPAPSDLGPSVEDTHQGVPFTQAKPNVAATSTARVASTAVPTAKPVQTNTSSLVPQAAAAVTLSPSPKRATSQKRVVARSSAGEDIVAKDTVTRFATHAAKAQAQPKPKPVKPSSDGIKRYSDLD